MAKPHANMLIFLFLVLYMQPAPAGMLTSPFNQRRLNLDQQVDTYSFLVGGHLYGTALNQLSVYPAPSLLANLERINDTGACLFMALGDIFRHADFANIDAFVHAFASKLEMPLLNAVGNHDVLDGRQGYEERFGPTYFHFVYQRELFIILDTILAPNRISGEQFEFFRAILESARKDTTIQNIFIFSHQPVWSESNPGEFVRTYDDIPNYNRELRPLLLTLAREKRVIWFSDDIGGGPEPLSLFFHRESTANLTYVATGLGDTKNDALIEVTVSRENGVSFAPFSLTGHLLQPLENYGVSYWQQYRTTGERDWKAKMSRLIYNRFFRFGILIGCGMVIIAAAIFFGFMIKQNRRKTYYEVISL